MLRLGLTTCAYSGDAVGASDASDASDASTGTAVSGAIGS